jgi:hypothetical protein
VSAVLLVLAAAAGADAQTPSGRIVGRIVDRTTGQGLSDVGVQVVGTTMGTMSGVDGRYALSTVPAGTVTLHVRRIGYQPKTITGIVLLAGGAVEQDVALDPASIELQTVEVTAASERGTVSEALDRQRNATGIVNAVTAEQISRSPDSDAAAAVQRVSGVTVQDGKYVFVRGLGERYTTTSLNGSRIPSPEPERKVVPLDLFPAALLQSVTTAKTFTPDQPGDFSGAQVNITTREFPAQRQVTYSASIGYNDRATGATLPAPPSEGLEWLGFAGNARRLPGIVAATDFFRGNPGQEDYNRMVSAFRNAWSVREKSGSPNTSMGLSIGGNDALLGRRIGYIAALSYAYGQEVRADASRAFAIPTGDGATTETERYDGDTGRSSVLWGGLLNLSTLLGEGTRVSLNNTFSRSADNEARSERGIDENSALPFHIQQLRFVERSVWSSQLATQHQIGSSHHLDVAVGASGVTRREPDRSEVVYAQEVEGGTPFLFASDESAVRTFGDLNEYSLTASGDYTLRFGAPGREHAVKLGGLVRYTDREADNHSYSIRTALDRQARELAPEEIFDGRFSQPGSTAFQVVPLSQGGSYSAEDLIGAGYAMLEYQLGDRVRLIGGARLEMSDLEVTSREEFGSDVFGNKEFTDVLPSLTLNVRLSETQNLRLSASQTLARPEYREIVAIRTRDIIGGEVMQGNPDLKRTLIQNADVRWEWYPDAGEVLSLGVFAKHFDDPIERVYRGTSGTRVTTFQNATAAVNYGAELELRKGLGFLSHRLDPLTVFSNVTVMTSEIDLSNVAETEGTVDENRAMVGQAPYVVNAGLTYTSESGGASATVLYNVVGRRIHSASLRPLPNVYEEARDVLDVSLRFPLFSSVAAKLDARNLLDAPYEITQGDVRREYYRAGRVISAGITWRR